MTASQEDLGIVIATVQSILLNYYSKVQLYHFRLGYMLCSNTQKG